MSQTGPKHVTSTRQNIRIEREYPVRLTPATGVVANVVTLTDVAGEGCLYHMGIDTDGLKGQMLIILEKTAGSSPIAGRTVMITGNTSLGGGTDTITIDEIAQGTNIYTSWPTYAVADWDRLAVTSYGVRPGAWSHNNINPDYGDASLERMWGIIDQADLPDEVHELEELYAHGSTNMPNRHVVVFNNDTHPVNMNLSAVYGRDISHFFGCVVDHASALTLNLDIVLDAHPGDNQVTLSGVVGIAVGGYIEIGVVANGTNEIRQITDVTGVVVTLDRPLCHFHDASDATEVVQLVTPTCYDAFVTAEGVTHTMTVAETNPTVSFGVHKKGEYDGTTVNDWYLVYLGNRFTELNFESTTSKEMTLGITGVGHNAVLDPTALDGVTAIVPPTLDDSPYWSDPATRDTAKKPVHFSRSTITVGGIEFPTMENYSVGITRTTEEKYVHAYSEANDGLKFGRKPLSYGGRVNYTHSFSLPLHKKRFYDLLQSREIIDSASSVFEIVRSTAFTETWTLSLDDIPVVTAGVQLPNTPTESQEITGPPESVSLAIFDKEPYY